jgi:site-specific recombinase XerD
MTKEEILQKLTKDLEARGRNDSTIKRYLGITRSFQDYFDAPADKLGESEIMEYQRYLFKEKGLEPSSVNDYNSALRFTYEVTLERALNHKMVPRVKQSRRIPQLFTRDEIAKIINSAGNHGQKTMFMLAYGSGLRLSEITNLNVSDIESNHMRILVRHGKGDRDRYALLPQATLEALREHWLAYRPKEWLFVAPVKGGKYVDRTLADAFKAALKRSGVAKHGSIHYFRHCFATHLYEDGASLLAIQKLLGHARVATTAWYIQLADKHTFDLRSPLDALLLKDEQHNEVESDA